MPFTRALARRGVLASIALVVLLLAGFAAAVADALVGAPASGLRTGLAEAPGADGAARWEVFRSDDPDEQAAAADGVLAPLGDLVDVSRSVQTSPVPLGDAGADDAAGAVLLVDPGAPGLAELVAGAWPEDAAAGDAGALPTALHADAARALGVDVGDTVVAGGLDLLIVGTWLPADARDPHWAGDPIFGGGVDADRVGPFLVADETALDDLSAGVYARWTAVPGPGAASEAGAARLLGELPRIADRLADAPGFLDGGVRTSGALAGTLDRLLGEVGAVRAIAPLPLLLLAVAGAAALLRLGAVLVDARRGETVLLRARGASAPRLAGAGALEVLVIAVPAAALGAAAGVGVAALLRPADARAWPAALLAAGAVVLLAVLAVAGSAWLDAGRPLVRAAGDAPSPLARGIALGGIALLVVAAGIAVWQLRLYGSPIVPGPGGAPAVDPIAVLAPVLALLALAALALLANRPLAALLERLARRSRGLAPALPLRWFARRTSLYTAASFTVLLGVAGLTFVSILAGTWQRTDERAAALAVGGDVRVVGSADPAVDELAAAASDGVVGAEVLRTDIRFGADTATLIALPADSLARVAPGALDAAAADALADGLRGADGDALPVALDPVAAGLAGAGPGDRIDLVVSSGGLTVEAVVVDVLDAVPGASGPAVLADLDRATAAVEQAGGTPAEPAERWLAADDPEAAANAVDAARPDGAVAVTRASMSASGVVGPAIGAALAGGFGALALALATLAALAVALDERRRAEVGVLRALGTPARTQAAARAAELITVAALALALGILVGWGAAALTGAALAGAAVPAAGGPAGGLAFDVWPWVVAVAVFALGVAAVAGLAARAVARRARAVGAPEEER